MCWAAPTLSLAWTSRGETTGWSRAGAQWVGSLVPRGSLRTTCNRLSVRLGRENPIPIALLDVHSKLIALGHVVSDQLETGLDKPRYNAVWNAVSRALTGISLV